MKIKKTILVMLFGTIILAQAISTPAFAGWSLGAAAGFGIENSGDNDTFSHLGAI